MFPSEFQPSYMSLEARGEVIVATFTIGELDDGENLEQMGQELFALIDQFGSRKVVVDLSQVAYIASSAIGKLIAFHRKLHRSQGKLALCALNPTVTEILQTSNLTNYFNVAENVEAAVKILH